MELLWYVSRASGLIALLLLTATMLLGITGVMRFTTPGWPRFVLAHLHRNLALLARLGVAQLQALHLGLPEDLVDDVTAGRAVGRATGSRPPAHLSTPPGHRGHPSAAHLQATALVYRLPLTPAPTKMTYLSIL